jgi:hypothetical protein
MFVCLVGRRARTGNAVTAIVQATGNQATRQRRWREQQQKQEENQKQGKESEAK